jgi:hypothetical protein
MGWELSGKSQRRVSLPSVRAELVEALFFSDAPEREGKPFDRLRANGGARTEFVALSDTLMLNLFQHPGSNRRAGGELDPEASSG